jgi:hypothetical protein
MIVLIEEACTAGARLSKACEVVDVSVRTVQRYRRHGEIRPDGRKAAALNRVLAGRNQAVSAERGQCPLVARRGGGESLKRRADEFISKRSDTNVNSHVTC